MLRIAKRVKPHECCIVPEKREELTTEGGLDVLSQLETLTAFVAELKESDILVSLFIDPDKAQIEASKQIGVDIVELHTGAYAEGLQAQSKSELARIKVAAKYAHSLGLQVNAGHGLHYQNVDAIAAIPELVCLNIGHSIVARASMSGFHEAVFAMKKIMIDARLAAEQE